MTAILALSIVGISACIFLAAIFITKRSHPSSFFLGLFFLLIAIRLGKLLAQEYATEFFLNSYFNLVNAAIVAIGPAIWLYIRTYFSNAIKKDKSLIHFMPSLLLLSCAFYWRQAVGEQIWIIIYWFTLIHPLVYVFLCLNFLVKNSRDQHITTSRKIWLYSIPGIIVFIAGTNILYFYYDFPFYLATAILLLLTLYIITYLLFKNKADFLFRINDGKYKNLNLPTDKIDELLQRITSVLEGEKLFLNDNIKLSTIADKIDIPAHIISMVINKTKGKSFPEYVNHLRIERARQKLIEQKDRKIIAIALESGFSSLTTFNRVFKRYTSCNPSEYRIKYFEK